MSVCGSDKRKWSVILCCRLKANLMLPVTLLERVEFVVRKLGLCLGWKGQ